MSKKAVHSPCKPSDIKQPKQRKSQNPLIGSKIKGGSGMFNRCKILRLCSVLKFEIKCHHTK